MKLAKVFGAVTGVLVIAFTLAAASHPKTTGDSGWINDPGGYNQQAHTTFNAIATTPTGLGAKGSAIYEDPNITYTMDVQFLKVSGNTAWFTGQVTSVTGNICCAVGNWI